MKFRLTKDNYYDAKRPHLSASRIIDYHKDPYFYKVKHIDKKIDFELSDDMKLGKFVDALLTQPEEAKKYYLKSRGDSDDYALSESQILNGKLRAEEAKRHPFWKPEHRHDFQVMFEAGLMPNMTLTSDAQKKGAIPLCGMADRIDHVTLQHTESGQIYIIDVKSTNPMMIDSTRKWYYTILERGYDIQFAMYRAMASLKYDVPYEDIRAFHLCLTSKDGYAWSKLFEIPKETMDNVDPLWRSLAFKIWNGEFPQPEYKTFDDSELCWLK